jgi:hypothetical protein
MRYHHDHADATQRANAPGLPAARTALVTAALLALLAAPATAAADTLLLQQNVPGNTAGTPFLLLDRGWISHVTVQKDTSLTHRVTIRIATEPPVELALTCNDEAITRQLLEALRRGATATLDVTGRCRL